MEGGQGKNYKELCELHHGRKDEENGETNKRRKTKEARDAGGQYTRLHQYGYLLDEYEVKDHEEEASYEYSCNTKSLFGRLIESGVVKEGERVVYRRRRDGSVVKRGWMSREGVACACCALSFSLSKFQGHAGRKHRRPSAYMFLEDDSRSIAMCLKQLLQQEQHQQDMNGNRHTCTVLSCAGVPYTRSCVRKIKAQVTHTDSFCQVCRDEVDVKLVGDSVQVCHGCPSVFHRACLDDLSQAEAEADNDDASAGGAAGGRISWFCFLCVCGHCGSHFKDIPTDQAASCIHIDPGQEFIVQDLQCNELCNIMLRCSQCHVQYHSSCATAAPDAVDIINKKGTWFCSLSCKDLFNRLRLLVGNLHALQDKPGLSWMLARCSSEDRFQSSSTRDCIPELSHALQVLRQCFHPITQKGIDLLSHIVFNRESFQRQHRSRSLDCSAFYTLMLLQEAVTHEENRGSGDIADLHTHNDNIWHHEVVCLATLRIHVSRPSRSASPIAGFCNTMAELPFVATNPQYRKQGLCKSLMLTLETLLKGLGVIRILLPSTLNMMDVWTGSTFNFRPLSPLEAKQVSNTFNLMSFHGTTLLHKSLQVSMAPGSTLLEQHNPTTDSAAEQK